MSGIGNVLGPRVPHDELVAHRARYRWPTLCFVGAMLALVVSVFLPYWVLDLDAPQFPQGLRVDAYVNRLVGQEDPLTGANDLEQLDQLNHYVGMPSLKDGAVLERTVSIAAIIVFAGLLLAAVYIHSRWVVLLVLPALVFPLVFLADLQYWLWNYGHSLDPRAPLASAVGEFTPHLFGKSKIAQFTTNALPGPGLLLAFLAAVLVGVGLWLHRRAYRPLVETIEEPERATAAATVP
jgi:hypothetical protein